MMRLDGGAGANAARSYGQAGSDASIATTLSGENRLTTQHSRKLMTGVKAVSSGRCNNDRIIESLPDAGQLCIFWM